MKTYKKTILYSGIALGVILSGCASVQGHKGSMQKMDGAMQSNNCDYSDIDSKIKKNDDTILWGIQGGSLARNCLDYKKSNTLFDKAESKYKTDVDLDSAVNNVGESAGAVLVNNNVMDYEGNTYEKVMVNTYKGLNFAQLGDSANARVEFNRALDRQRRAKSQYKKEIAEKQKELKKSAKEMKIAKNKKTQSAISKHYDGTFSGFKAYPDFINPFTTYISGIYFMLDGDNRKARSILRDSMNMDPTNSQIRSDYALSKKGSLKKSRQKYAWVIFENGQGMVKDEIKVDIPLFLVSKNAFYTGIALPKLTERPKAYSHLSVNGKNTKQICNMDNVIKTEFKKRLPGIVTEAVVGAVAKTVIQKQLSDEHAGLGLLGAIYQAATNTADVRSWTSLPKNFQSVRVPVTGKPIVIKDSSGKVIKTVKVPKSKNAMIYVKSFVPGNDKVHEMFF